MTNAVKDFLIRAKALIDTPEKWHKGDYSIAKPDGTVCYCAVGAIFAAGGTGQAASSAWDALIGALPEGFHGLIPRFNDADETTHADIMALFDRAIASVDA